MFDLYIGNKNYSSWSLRTWLLMKHFAIPFTEHMVSVAGRDYNAALKPLAGNARVPCLHEDGFQVWESIAIAETLAERHPQMWPADARARARARSISAEMHAGFAKLRTAMPMNLKFKLKGKPATPEVQRDIDRVIEIWSEARSQFATSMFTTCLCRRSLLLIATPCWPIRQCVNGTPRRSPKLRRTPITISWPTTMAARAESGGDFKIGVFFPFTVGSLIR